MPLKSNWLYISAGSKVDYNMLVLKSNGLCIGAGSVSGLHHVGGQRTCHWKVTDYVSVQEVKWTTISWYWKITDYVLVQGVLADYIMLVDKDMSLKSNWLCISTGSKVDYNLLVLKSSGLCIGAGSQHVGGQRTCHWKVTDYVSVQEVKWISICWYWKITDYVLVQGVLADYIMLVDKGHVIEK